MRISAAILLLSVLLPFAANAETATAVLRDGTSIDYVVVLPTGYDPGHRYPLLLAFPGGGQQIQAAQSTVDRFWAPEAQKRGVIVVAPAAPSDGRVYYFQYDETRTDAIDLIPEFLDRIRSRYPIADGKIHLGGHSNGGISAFRIAVRHPEFFESMTVIAGCPAERVDAERLGLLKDIRISLFVGGRDPDWGICMTQTRAELNGMGVRAFFQVVPGGTHVLPELSFEKSGPIFDTVIPPG